VPNDVTTKPNYQLIGMQVKLSKKTAINYLGGKADCTGDDHS